jgi:hypothetical protein
VVTLAVKLPSAPLEAVMLGSTVWPSARSTSLKVTLPLSLRVPTGTSASVMLPVRPDVATTGVSFVPVTRMSRVEETLRPPSRVTMKANWSVTTWSRASCSTSAAVLSTT